MDGRRVRAPATSRRYLLSIGVSFRSVHGHWYIDVRRKYLLRHFRVLGFTFVWTTYRKVEMPERLH